MAGQSASIRTPENFSLPLPGGQAHAANPLPALHASTRTRRHHGAFTVGGQLACVYSTRRAGLCYGVSFELGAGTLTLASAMTPNQARAMARALMAAANAADVASEGAAA